MTKCLSNQHNGQIFFSENDKNIYQSLTTEAKTEYKKNVLAIIGHQITPRTLQRWLNSGTKIPTQFHQTLKAELYELVTDQVKLLIIEMGAMKLRLKRQQRKRESFQKYIREFITFNTQEK